MILPTNLTAEEIYGAAAAAGARPDPLLTISQWADRYRWLSQRASAEHGRWRTERTPYLREIMDCLSPSSLIERVAFMKGAQIGGTECGNNWMGYVIHQAPGPMMSVQPTVEMAKRNSKQRIEPLIEESEVLWKLVRDPRSRDSGNTVLSKDFPGGVLVMTGANSAVGLRSMAARYLFLYEVDAYPGDVEGEGDPITLAMARADAALRTVEALRSDVKPAVDGAVALELDAKDSWDDVYWDVKALVGSATVAARGVAETSEAVGKAAPQLAESALGIGKSTDAIAADVHTATSDFVKPKTFWQRMKAWLETAGKVGARFL
jgi:phage terminase large subunit GpA-like protein